MKKTIASVMVIALMASMTTGWTSKVNATELEDLKTTEVTLGEETEIVEVDNDGDGLVNWLEEYFGTSDENTDSDGDGLSDYAEVYELHTDPTKKDSDDNGLLDGDEDLDGDGITNLQEYSYGTNPYKKDSDGDGLSDYEELFNYGTDPMNSDSDNDGAVDGWEALNGYSPLQYNDSFVVEKELISMDEKLKFNVTLNEGTGEQASYLAVEELYEDFDLNESIPGFISSGYEIISNEDLTNVTVSFEIEDELLNSENFTPSIYYYDNEEKVLKEVELQESEGNIITGEDYGHKKYILLNKYEFNKVILEKKATLKTAKEITLQETNLDNVLVIKDLELEPYIEIQSVSATASTSTTDSDYDGRNDSIDASPNDNNYTATLTTGYATSQVSYKMDYRWFFQSNTTYKKDLSVVSSLLSSAIYSDTSMNIYDTSKTNNCNSSSISTILSFHGFTNIEVYKLSTNYSDSHLSEVALGYRPVTYNGVTKNVVMVLVRGTNGTIQEWSSNFDLGDTGTFSSFADWTKSTNHKGFDISANRIITKLNSYLTAKGISSANNVFWVTGHSRGAAIANIIGAKLTDSGKTNYTYTFAAPNTTTATNTANYTSIFNILNSDDFVPYLPMSKWGYKRYGKVATASIASSYETAWESLLGKFDYNPDTYGMQDTINKLAAIATNGNHCYKYTCTHHGDGSLNNITIRNYGMSESSREAAIAKIPNNALPYGKLTRYTGSGIAGWDFELCQTPSYFMQVLAAKMAGTISNYRFVVELDVASRYESAKTAIIASAIGGLEHPHYTETYYLLATKLTASSF